VPLAAAALQFVLTHPAVTTTVIGTGSADRIIRSVALARHPIIAAFWNDLSAEGLLNEEHVAAST